MTVSPDQSASSDAAIRLSDIHVRFGTVAALRDLNISVARGELLTVLGPSGSGKSTLLNVISGSIYPDGGTIEFDGEDVTTLASHKRRVGMVFQKYTLFPNKTVAENVAFPLAIRKTGRDETARRVKQAIELVGLREQADRYPSQISGGQAQRAAVARAVVFNPAILLMDEPLGALDRTLRKTLQFEIRSLQRRLAVPTLYVTHDQEEAMSLSDRIVILKDGAIAAQGAPRDLYENPNSVWTATFLGDANCFAVSGALEERDGTTFARLASGTAVPVSQARQLAPGAKPTLVIRPENCTISRSHDPTTAFCKATVNWHEYLGSIQRVRITVEGVDAVIVIPSGQGVFEAGETVFVGWKPNDALIVGDQ